MSEMISLNQDDHFNYLCLYAKKFQGEDRVKSLFKVVCDIYS